MHGPQSPSKDSLEVIEAIIQPSLFTPILRFVFWMPIGYLMRPEHGRISIEIRVSQAYYVLIGLFVVQIGIDSRTKDI
jgi:hypothetical protein